MTREERLKWLKQIEKDINVCSIESTLADDMKSCAIHSAIEELEQEPCEDCVNRQTVLNTLFYKSDNNCEVVLNKELQDRIKALPSVTPQQKIGYWINAYPDIEPNPMFMYGICSVCGFKQSISNKLNYCPNCGAKMEVEEC